MLVILRSEVRKDLVLLVVLSASEESGFDVILSVSEGSGVVLKGPHPRFFRPAAFRMTPSTHPRSFGR
jgi:hypothetical protein